MSPQSKREYLEAIYLRYKQASIKERTSILNEFCATCGYHRKHAIRLINNFRRFTQPEPRKRGKPSRYNVPTIIEPLKRIWLAANQPCSKRLKAILLLWLPYYTEEFCEIPQWALKALLGISHSTIDRIFKPIRSKYSQRGRSTTKPGTLLRKHIPIKTNQWDESVPGFIEADTVAHCGDTIDGIYAITTNFTDIATGWTEQRASWGKSEAAIFPQIKHVEHSLPFHIKGFDSDNGNEFINH